MPHPAGLGLLFCPRGGSAQVARYLARSLPDAGWDVTIACGSLGSEGEPSNADTFYAGLDVRALDYTPSRSAPAPPAAAPPPPGRRPAVSALLRGPRGRAGPGVREGGRRRLRADRGDVGAPA